MKRLSLTLGVLLVGAYISNAAVVTLTAESSNGTNGMSDLSIGPYEVAELVSFPARVNDQNEVLILKDGKTFGHVVRLSPNTPQYFDPVIVAGPATIRLITAMPAPDSGPFKAFCTLRITPEAYPPDQALLLPPGTNQAVVSLEASTNLVQWSATTNGVYGPLPVAMFFRIKLEPTR